ncbi:putative calcium-activated potassium channel [Trypanosoma cruzi]|uniref:Uncharacterized protein n=2 Tax=Trypanosoma cruzi TaxID=5693 RepID=Q4DP52_TRYCC|nr:hypothetical protein, conserved [Trypanosoma cruzi]EAN94300.1 hypothetical protein, conserved [Trypanosoma cruzi]PWV12591.1 putative calcium-activated potassium channel [Trypanosoma cruzi]RNC48597.1 calcium/potassium channel (CAKC) [Trypanosoma cruzi]|eukprot:XP_816151.1 hypothetical protein [Trypanosoma cruzi strain CL Brener]
MKGGDNTFFSGVVPEMSISGGNLHAGDDVMNDVVDLTMIGHDRRYAAFSPYVRSWRYRNRTQYRPTRRAFLLQIQDHEREKNTRSDCKSSFLASYFSYFCGPRWRGQPPFGFPMMTGPKLFFQAFVRKHPVLAICVWLFLFVCETAIVTLYIVQTTRPGKVTWVEYGMHDFDWYATTQTILSIVLLSQLLVAYNVGPVTITIVLVTSGYRIITYFVALVSGMGWVSRLYVPLFLRCWPMRQYFLFVLDSLATFTPRNHRLDVIRFAAGPLSFFVALLFTFGCIFHMHQVFRGYNLEIDLAIYWMVVTISTVGYGDIIPHGLDGHFLAIVIICVFLAMMSSLIMLVISTTQILREFPRYTGRRNHFFVYGHVSREDAVSILEEVLTLYPMKTVCFCYTAFSPDVLAIGRHPRYRLRSKFLQVKFLDRVMLERLRISESSAIIILPGKDAVSKTVDADSMLWSTVFQRRAPHVPQYLRLRFAFHARLLRGRGMFMIDQNNKFIMSAALLLPGVLPFLVNLVRISSASGISPPNLWDESEKDNWKNLYEYSRRNIFATCPVPWFFVHLTISRAVRLMKLHDVLVVGVEEGSRKVMRLDLEYALEQGDTLLVIHERGRVSLLEVLKRLEPGGSGAVTSLGGSTVNNDAFVDSQPNWGSFTMSGQDLFGLETDEKSAGMNDNKLYYPFNRSFDLMDEEAAKAPPGKGRGAPSWLSNGVGGQKGVPSPALQELLIRDSSMLELRRQLLQEPFVDKHPGGVSLKELPLGDSASMLRELLSCRRAAISETHDTTMDSIERLEQQINDILTHVAAEYTNGVGKEDSTENFLFIDQVTSFKKPAVASLYEKYLDEDVSHNELSEMMHSIHSIYTQSRLTLLTSRKLSKEFLDWWKRTFRYPLRYIRGLSTSESHLEYAIWQSGGISKLRGILLYCSQLGAWDFSDIPLITVGNNVCAKLEASACHPVREPVEEETEPISLPEQNVVLELKSFVSCISVSPYHTDPEWRRRGEKQFQDSLAFMMGRCFSPNMLQTIFIHAHHDQRIIYFFAMVLQQQGKMDHYDVAPWLSCGRKFGTAFQLCGNQLLHFQTFGDAFSFLLSRRSWVAIGVFRLFPASEGLPGLPRYFITNPPLRMPLRPDDVIYALSALSNTLNTADGQKQN